MKWFYNKDIQWGCARAIFVLARYRADNRQGLRETRVFTMEDNAPSGSEQVGLAGLNSGWVNEEAGKWVGGEESEHGIRKQGPAGKTHGIWWVDGEWQRGKVNRHKTDNMASGTDSPSRCNSKILLICVIQLYTVLKFILLFVYLQWSICSRDFVLFAAKVLHNLFDHHIFMMIKCYTLQFCQSAIQVRFCRANRFLLTALTQCILTVMLVFFHFVSLV